MKISEILNYLEDYFPLSKQEEWDHSGLQLGNIHHEVSNVLITLNVDENTINQAIEHHAELIISHHPFLFHSLKTIDTDMIQGKNIELLLKNDITVYSMHTNYDALYMNHLILEKLGCKEITPIDSTGTLRGGTFDPIISFDMFLQHIKSTFDLPIIRYCGNPPSKVQRVAFCAGSGHDFMDEAFEAYDVYVTGDITYSHAMDVILRKNIVLIDVPHYIEAVFKEDLKKRLVNLNEIHLWLSKEKDYFTYI